MKPQQLNGNKKESSGAAAALSLQEELVAAIHGAFEVAVQIAVREVKKLAGQATSDIYVELRRENESLKEKLQKAEAALESTRTEEVGCRPVPPKNRYLIETKRADQPPHPECTKSSPYPEVGSVHGCSGLKGVPTGPQPGVYQPTEPQDEHMTTSEEQKSNQGGVNNAPSDAKTHQNNDCMSNGAPACESLPLPGQSSLEQVTVKQERLEDTIEGSSCFVDSIKMEEFSLEECMSAVQSKMLEQWKPVVSDSQSQDLNFQLSSAELDEVDSSIQTTNICPDTDQLSSEFPNIFQGVEPAPTSEASPQVIGVFVRTSRHLSHSLHTCKSCGQAFHLPSLLRRHNAQCQQRLQQRFQQPVTEGKRTKLQLYPPGCSPFICTVCNREFNRLENLKTHLRIHTGERPYSCSVCSKCFRHSGALTRHFRIHTGEKPYICGQCGKSFRNCGGLRFHQRTHNRQLQ